MFALLPECNDETVTVTVNGEAVSVPRGFTAAAAMLLHAGGATRTTPVSGQGRAPYCMMGVCFECLMQIDGEPNQQGCLVIVREGMRINRQLG
ncbi:MAG: (2Fe-2S)-binding protein, partial [Betaproteobacteria bacterium]